MLTILGQRLLSSSVSLKSALIPFQIISIKRLIDPFYSGLYGAVSLYIILYSLAIPSMTLDINSPLLSEYHRLTV